VTTDQEHATANAASPGPVVVGVDGSNAAIRAAEWAAIEAIHQDVHLRLVHVIALGKGHPVAAENLRFEQEYTDSVVRAACVAVEATGLPVKTDTAVIRGKVDSVLLTESGGATLVCVGSVGIGRVANMVLGSTATALAEQAHCPVAIIRSDDNAPSQGTGYIAVVIDDQPGNDEVMRWAMEEARVRKAPVLALGVWRWALFGIGYEKLYRRIHGWLQQYPDVEIEVAATRTSVTRYLEGYIGAVQLVVIGSEDANRVAQLVGPHSVPILAHADCSVLVVRS
jgi:nucleotide-binding universal stress UspA family protein